MLVIENVTVCPLLSGHSVSWITRNTAERESAVHFRHISVSADSKLPGSDHGLCSAVLSTWVEFGTDLGFPTNVGLDNYFLQGTTTSD